MRDFKVLAFPPARRDDPLPEAVAERINLINDHMNQIWELGDVPDLGETRGAADDGMYGADELEQVRMELLEVAALAIQAVAEMAKQGGQTA